MSVGINRITANGRVYLAIETFEAAVANPERAWVNILDAVAQGFPHLAWMQIESPPSGYFDAVLARQIGFYILCIKFGVPKKRAMDAAGLTPDAKWRCFNRVANRMTTMVFRNHVNAIAEDARQRILRERAR